MTRRGALAWGLLAALLASTFVIRGPITSVPPALGVIRDDLHLSAAAAGLVTTLPLICFGVFACLTTGLTARFGAERTLGLALLVLVIGIAMRSVAGTSTFFLGTLGVGLGIAVANVVIPAIARTRFADSLGRVMGMYTVMIQLSGSAGAFITRPLMDGAGFSWSLVVGIWFVPAIIALGWWTLAAGRRAARPAKTGATVTGMRHVVRRPVVWGIVLVMGLQSFAFYSLVNWLPTVLQTQGWSAGAAGAALGAFSLLGFPGSLFGSRILLSTRRTWWLVGVAATYVIGLGLLIAGHLAAFAGVILCGLCLGPTLAIALSAIAHQVDPTDVPAVSAVGQGAGYLLAALGPVTIGALYGARNDFVAAISLLVLVVLGWAWATFVVGRSQDRTRTLG